MLGFFPKKRAGLAALLIAVSACAQTPPASVSGWTASVLLSVEGKVEVAAAGNTNWMVARTNQVLQVGDRLRTGLRSRAAIRLSDKSVLRVNELTTLKLQPPPRDSNAPVLDLGSGSTYFFSREKPAAIEFRTPLASGAIRGTEFDLAVAEDGRTALALLRPRVVRQRARATGIENRRAGRRGTGQSAGQNRS